MAVQKGTLITNSFLRTHKFAEHYEWLSDAAKKHGAEIDLMENADILAGYETDSIEKLQKLADENSFILYWDKDIRFGKLLEVVCREKNVPIYNSIEAIALCDDKSATYRKIWQWNIQHSSNKIPLVPSLVSPMTYPNIGYTNTDFLKKVTDTFDFPIVVKECFGSFGMQVYIAHDEKELLDITVKLAGKPLLYQKFMKESSGFDVRLQVVGEKVVASMYRYSTDGDFRANVTNGAHMKPYTPSEKECELAVRTTKALGLDFAGVDMLFSRGKGYEADVICEVNSNAHFKNIYECTGVNVADKIIEYILSY